MEEVGKSFYFLCLRQGVIDFSLSIKNIDILTKFFAFKTRPENFQKICNPKKSPFLEFQRIFRNFSENRPGISENRQFSITSHERDDMC